MLRALFATPAFRAAHGGTKGLAPVKIKRPMAYWAGLFRALDADPAAILVDIPPDAYDENHVDYYDRAEAYLAQMDQLPFRWPAPDGYPEAGHWWSGTHVMVGRWNFAMQMAAGELPGIDPDLRGQTQAAGIALDADAIVDYWTERIIARPLLDEDRARLVDFVGRGRSGPVPEPDLATRLPMLAALLFDSPYFIRR